MLQAHLWNELVFLYEKCEEYDKAAKTIIKHPIETWRHKHFCSTILKV